MALTFDAGSDAGNAGRILDLLAVNSIKATFGITGTWADANPALVRRIANEGHQILNHTYSHPSFTGRSTNTAPLSRQARLAEVAQADQAIRDVTGRSTIPWFRPPYGDEDASVRADVALAGYQYEVMWTVDSLGWKGLAPEQVVARCLAATSAGTIYLMHVGSASTDFAALPQLLDAIKQRGFGFATVADLIRP